MLQVRWVMWAALALAGCTDGGDGASALLDAAAFADATVDAEPDATVDMFALDAAPDAFVLDAEPDAELDVELDAEPDAELDAELDAAPDAEPDAEPDAIVPDAAPPPAPWVTEVMAASDGVVRDEDGDDSDWIELFNPYPWAIDLGGWHLSDDEAEPLAWGLPEGQISSMGHLLVFASGKDRLGDPAHTNFRLARAGEVLTLAWRDGSVAQRVEFPPQVQGVSYGAHTQTTRTALLGAAPPGHARAAFDGDAGWRALDVELAGWTEIVGGVGVTTVEAEALVEGVVVADSVADWSSDGVQGANGWTYGYVDRTAAPEGAYAADDFISFPRRGGVYGPDDFWTGSAYDWFQGNPPWTTVGQRAVHPNGANNGAVHWAVRRWTSEVTGSLVVTWDMAKSNPNGTGVSGHLFHEGAVVDSAAIAGDDIEGVRRTVRIDGVQVGDRIDLAHDAVGPDGNTHDGSDGSVTGMQIQHAADYAASVETEGTALLGDGPGLYLRYTFEVDDPAAFDRLALDVRFDDGFVAWINRVAVAEVGAPEVLDAASHAVEDRPGGLATTPTRFLVNPGVLHAGRNVLAVHALNGAAPDEGFLFAATLEGQAVVVDVARPVYQPYPTPGADNAEGVADLGPLLVGLTRDPALAEGDAPQITVQAFETGAAVAELRLWYRVGFGDEVEVPMFGLDDGVFVADLPVEVATPGALLRWRVEATDVEGRVAQTPPFESANDSERYYGAVVGDPSLHSALPILHWFLDNPPAADTNGGARGVVWFDGELYDNILVDLHGQSSRSFPKKSYDLDLNRDHRFRLRDDLPRMKDVNLLTNYADKSKLRNTLAYEVYAMSGGAYHLAMPIRIQRNGAFFAVYDFVEDGDDRWIERLSYGSVGALYKMYDGMFNASRGEKKTRRDEGDEDLRALVAGVALEGEARRLFLYDHVDLPRMANFMAGMFITADTDCCHKNYYAYRDTEGTGAWWYMPWDVDLTFGRNWTGNYYDDRMYPQNPLYIGRSNNALMAALVELPEFNEMYLRRTRTLVDEIMQPPETPVEDLRLERRAAALEAQLAEDAVLDEAAWPTWGEPQTLEMGVRALVHDFLVPRRAWIYGSLTRSEVVEAPAVLSAGDATVRWRVPLDDGADWREVAFDDGDWAEGPMGLGYEDDAPGAYAGLIQTEVRPLEAAPEALAVQARLRFEVADVAALETLVLRARYDDGMVVWLNGVEVARRNHPNAPGWATAGIDHPDGVAAVYEVLSLGDVGLGALRAGENVLAVHVANVRPGSSDLLLQVELLDGLPVGGEGPLPAAQAADVTVQIGASDAAVERPEGAYVRLDNPSEAAIDLSGWRLQGDGILHRFPGGTVLVAGGALYVVGDARGFKARAEAPSGGQGLFVQGNWQGRLAGVGALVLFDAAGQVR